MFSEPAVSEGAPLSTARARSMERAARLVAAARDLADERHSSAFTVHEVAARAGSSLKGFYRCFTSKDDLLVALLAEDSALGATILADRVATEPTHAGRLHACVTGLLDLCTLPGAEGYARVLVSEHRRLSQERPDDLAAALAPIVQRIGATIAAAAAAGAAVSDDPRRDAETVFSLVLDGIHTVSFGRAAADECAAHLWRFCGRALCVPDLDPDRGCVPGDLPQPGGTP